MDDRMTAIRTEFREAEPEEILHKAPHAILGVTAEAENALSELEISSVFDLATSAVFEAACKLVEAGTDLRSAVARHGAPTSDIVRDSVTAGKPISELQYLPIRALRGVPVTKASAIAAALDTPTVRDFAYYPPFRAARDLLRSLYFPESDATFDPERPTDLVPSTGEYPTERVQYQTLLMDAGADGATGLVDINSKNFAPLDLKALSNGATGFKAVAFGALLTYTQSWFSQGVTLGQLLHSVALAPGESTRIAVVDWTRRSRAGETEVISEEDELSNEAEHNRAISEVTNAVATEAQSGFSHSSTFATSTEVGASHAVDVSGPLGSLLGGVNASSAQSVSNATSMGTADSYSSSFGQRTVGSSMGQNIADRTHQNAHSSRTRRASVVKEVSQSEHESVSTRVLANYNHMHALTVQYYEVVQVHRVDLTLARADRVVFIPVKLLDFADEQLIRRFRGVLARAALTNEIFEALSNLDVIELRPDAKQEFSALGQTVTQFITRPDTPTATGTGFTLEAMVANAVAREVSRGRLASTDATAEKSAESSTGNLSIDDKTTNESIKPSRQSRAAMARTAVQTAKEALWDSLQASRMSNLLGQAVVRDDSASLYLPTDVSIERAFVDSGGTVVQAVFTLRSGASDTTVSASDPILVSDVTKIDLRGASPEGDVDAKLVLTLNRNGVRFPLELPTVRIPQGRKTDTPLVSVRTGAVDVNLSRHLAANRLYYSTAVLRSLDAAQLALLLSGLSIGIETVGDAGPETRTVPIAQVIDPLPICYIGNYLAFRMSVDSAYDTKWKKWLDDHAVSVGKLYNQDIVPLGTGGVFAEAVLGRSNAAEKLDITRFWDWQDSPIPLQPTDVAAIQTGSRATQEDTKPGQLSTPIVNITSPTALPDPVGTAAILQAIQNGSMFRDMSGLQATIGLLQSGIGQTMAGASAAGQQAGENMNNLLKATTDRQRTAAEMVTDLARTAASVYTGGAIPAGGGMSGGARGGGGGGSSQQGAKINYFDKTAKEGQTPSPAVSPGGQAGPGLSVVGGGTPAGGQSNGSKPSTPTATGTTYTENPAARYSLYGDSKAPADVAQELMNSGASVISGSEPKTGVVESARAWPVLDPDAVLPRIEELRQKPALLEYGQVGLPVAANFLHSIARSKPAEFAEFGRTLFASGLGFLGDRKVNPSAAVRNTDYGELAVNYYPAAPAQADWMMQVAVRDSASWLTGSVGQDSASVLATATKELADFFDSTGWYADVHFFDDVSHPSTKNYPLHADGSNHVFIWLREGLTQLWRTPVRMISLSAKPVFDIAKGQVTLSWWVSGLEDFTSELPIASFEANYLGMTVATLQ